MVVMAVPLASSTHLKLEPFTEAVVGAVDVGVGEGVVAVALGVGVVDAVAEGTLVGLSLCLVHEETPRTKTTINTNPTTLPMSLPPFGLGLLPVRFVYMFQ